MATTTAPVRVTSTRRTAALRAWLAASGYDQPGLRTLLGSASSSLVDAIAAPAARRRLALADTPAAILARLFLLGDEVSRRRRGPAARPAGGRIARRSAWSRRRPRRCAAPSASSRTRGS